MTASQLAPTEEQWQLQVVELARIYRWRVAHFRAARTAKGWRTPVAADGVGFPDLTLVRPPRLIFAELKSDSGRTRPEQTAWLVQLEAVRDAVNDLLEDALGELAGPVPGVEVYVWRPRDWSDVTAILRPDAATTL